MSHKSSLAKAIDSNCHEDGITETSIPGLKLYRSEICINRRPVVYHPAICLVAQGQKKMHYGDVTCSYDSDNYLINSLTIPVEAEVLDASDDAPYLGLSLQIDSYLIGQLLIDMDQAFAVNDANNEVAVSTQVTEHLNNCLIRLLDCLENEMDRKVLAPTLKREIFYEVLKGSNGDILRNCVANHAGSNKIAPVIQFIEDNFHTPLDVETIAKFAGMSPSTLHDRFKQITSMSPMQFVKSLRLHKAHSLLLSGNPASEASYQVGYNSPSQFSREFKRFFGDSPRNIQASAK